jgi:hypothetical protein
MLTHAGAWPPVTAIFDAEPSAGARARLPGGDPLLPRDQAPGGRCWQAGSGGTARGATIALNLASLSFMLPLCISQGAVTRVGNLLGARRPHDAQRAAWVAIAFGAAVMGVCGAGFLILSGTLPRLYTADLR